MDKFALLNVEIALDRSESLNLNISNLCVAQVFGY